ncbi:hypothetical protein SAMN05428972_3825 [Rhodanobacter sp. OK091]|nr:hypothetical protein SAMN05428972_3825 [Rhodanobacter sp. OK091]
MTYTKRELSVELAALLAAMPGAVDYVKVSSWAYSAYVSNNDLEPEVSKLLVALGAMDLGPEFEFSELELRQIAGGNQE